MVCLNIIQMPSSTLEHLSLSAALTISASLSFLDFQIPPRLAHQSLLRAFFSSPAPAPSPSTFFSWTSYKDVWTMSSCLSQQQPRFSVRIFCVSYFLHCCNQLLTRLNFREEQFLCLTLQGDTVHHGKETGNIMPTDRKQRIRNVSTLLWDSGLVLCKDLSLVF